MSRKFGFINNIAFQAALIIIGLSVASLVHSVILYRESNREIALKEVENKATIFLSAMETSVRRLVMEKDSTSIIELIQERAEFIWESLNFAIVGAIVRDPQGVVLEHKIQDPDGLIYDPGRPSGMEKHRVPKDFQQVIDTGLPLVKRQIRKLRTVEGQPEVRVIEVLYPIKKRQKGELLAVVKLVISVERTFELIRLEYEKIIKRVVLGFTVSTILLILGIMLFLRRQIIKPVLSIHDGASQVASGNLEITLKPTGSNEISSLMHTFNKMVEGLKHRDQMRRSLEVAMEVQQNLLPRENPRIKGLDIAGMSLYCDETGGDYYDFIEFDGGMDNRLAVVIGDVSGHGVSSALLMASTRAFLRQRSALPGSGADIVSDVNTQLSRDVAESGSFMTMFYLIIDQADRSLSWVRAGHDPGVIYDPDSDDISELRGAGIALGVDADFQYEQYRRVDLVTGQIILLGTDGIWEARDSRGEMFGKEPIYALLRKHKELDSTRIVEKILQALREFQQGADVEDDVTLIVIKLTQDF